MKFVDYYTTLGVARDASPEQISRAFRKLARQYHPDVNKSPEAETRFKEINEAHEVLKDPEKRKRYDLLGQNHRSGDTFRPPPGFESFRFHGAPGGGGFGGASFAGGDFSDFFNSLFGGLGSAGGGGFNFQDFAGGGRARPRRGADVEAEMTVTLEEVFHGSEKTLTFQDPESGQRQTYTVSVPQGIESGKKIRLAGQGAPSGGTPGDLLITLNIAPHPVYTRSGKDLECDLDVTPWEAALGATLPVPTLDGRLEITLPPGTSTGRRLRLKGHGMSATSGTRGDLYVKIRVVVPDTLNDTERDLFAKLAAASRFVPKSRPV